MTRDPLFSIVTPTMNRMGLLEQTVASLRAQTFQDFEHIIVDGGSTDGTLDFLRGLEGSHPLRWISEPDEGMFQAINKGLRMARGELVAYLNSDDLYFPWTLDVMAQTFRARPSADFVYGDALNIDDETGVTRIYWMPPFDLDYVRRFRCLLQPVVFWRRAVHDRIGYFDEKAPLVADCEFWMRAGAGFRFVKINEFVAIERDHAGTLRETAARAAGSSSARGSDEGLRSVLDNVRSRYIDLRGERHRRSLRRHLLRARVWTKLYGLGLALQSFIPSRIRRGPWSRLLATGEPRIARIPFFLMHLPRMGPRFAHRAIRASRYWLEPARWEGRS